MARIDFGYTWWGERWLNALTHIDYSNRLPRGVRYARNGSVRSINISPGNITARVQGTRSSPYKITLKPEKFTTEQKNHILQMVQDNPYYLAQLGARMLPPELEKELAAKKIKLFPDSWKQLSMHCSCPDWAVPCKHLAAVIYIIANEIDKNPFLVFYMHDLDLLAGIRKKYSADTYEDIAMPDLNSLLADKIDRDKTDQDQDRSKDTYGELESIDLSRIPDLYPAVSQILTENPLFSHEKDFKQVLLGALKKVSRKTEAYIKTQELEEELPEILYPEAAFTMKKNTLQAAGRLKNKKKHLTFTSAPAPASSSSSTPAPASSSSPADGQLENLIAYLQVLPAENLRSYPPVLSLLIILHNFALQLLARSAAVPEIIKLDPAAESYGIRWVPALFDPEIAGIADRLTAALPHTLVTSGRQPLKPREQILTLTSLFIGSYLQLFAPVSNAARDPITALFFTGEPYRPRKFEEKENPHIIHLWLGRFQLRPLTHHPVIHIEEAGNDEFTFQIRIRNHQTPEELPVTFPAFLAGNDPETLPVLRELSLLGTYLPTVNAFLRSPAGILQIDGRQFIEEWFSALPVLKTLGIHTIIPKSLKETFVPRLSLKVGIASGNDGNAGDKAVSYTSLRDILAYDWCITAGDSRIDPEDFLALKKQYGSFIRYKDLFFEVDDRQLGALVRSLEKAPVLSPMDLLKTGLTGTFNGVPGEMTDETRQMFDAFLTPQETPVPENLQAELRPYQLRGYHWLCHNHHIGLGSILADDMGLGKTVQVIAFLLKLKNEGTLTCKHPALIIVPASLMTNWVHEITRFAPAPALAPGIYHGTDRELPDQVDIVITTYALARRDNDILKKVRWTLAIVDEAQNLKNPDTAQTKAVKSLKARYYLAMTGTPVENRLLDYWSILDFVMKGYAGSRKSFKENFAVPIERLRDRASLDIFRKITAPVVMRRLKTDRDIIDDLPEKLVSNRYLELTIEQSILYRELVEQADAMLGETDGIQRSGLVFKMMTGLKQICCHPQLYTKQGDRKPELSCKAEMLLSLLETIAERDEKALIFTQYAEMGTLLKEFIENRFASPCLFLYGGSTRVQRDTMIEAFQQEPSQRFMVLSIKAGGVGLNLTAANHVIHYDLWWNPAVENQATDRAFRIGQEKNVMVYRLIARGTFEERIAAMIESKEELANLTVAQGEQWLTKLSSRELKAFLRLQEKTGEAG